jgi:cobalamin synthase
VSPELRQDLHDLAAVVTIVLGLLALVAWIRTWPGWLVPQALSVVGAAAYLAIRVGAAITLLDLAREGGATRSERRSEAVRGAIVAAVVIAIVAVRYPVAGRVFGGAVLVSVFAIAAPAVVRAARRRYSAEGGRSSDTE